MVHAEAVMADTVVGAGCLLGLCNTVTRQFDTAEAVTAVTHRAARSEVFPAEIWSQYNISSSVAYIPSSAWLI